MSDAEVLVEILRRWMDEREYYSWSADRGYLTLDGTVKVTAEEIAAIDRLFPSHAGGGAWWDTVEGRRQT